MTSVRIKVVVACARIIERGHRRSSPDLPCCPEQMLTPPQVRRRFKGQTPMPKIGYVEITPPIPQRSSPSLQACLPSVVLIEHRSLAMGPTRKPATSSPPATNSCSSTIYLTSSSCSCTRENTRQRSPMG